MLRAWEIAKLEKELAQRSREKQNKESELEIELARYKHEAEKIPGICDEYLQDCNCRHTYKGREKWEYCPQICPNWRGGKRDEAYI